MKATATADPKHGDGARALAALVLADAAVLAGIDDGDVDAARLVRLAVAVRDADPGMVAVRAADLAEQVIAMTATKGGRHASRA